MVPRCCLLLNLRDALGVGWFVEQPGSSLMLLHNRVANLFKCKVRTWMGMFGAPTKKPTYLLGGMWAPWVMSLKRALDNSIQFDPIWRIRQKGTSEGAQVTGQDLQQTQEYPPGFAPCVYEAHQQYLETSPELGQL